MKPDHYADIILRSDAGVTIPVIAAQVMRVLHTCFQARPDTYALAFPEMKFGEDPKLGRVLRLFAGSQSEVEHALDQVENDDRLKPFALIGRIRQVPADYDGGWVTYQRYRIPARRGKSPTHQEKRLRLRAKKLDEARLLPYLILKSTSTQQTFSLIIEQQKHVLALSRDGTPDVYGLSRKEAPVFLPTLG